MFIGTRVVLVVAVIIMQYYLLPVLVSHTWVDDVHDCLLLHFLHRKSLHHHYTLHFRVYMLLMRDLILFTCVRVWVCVCYFSGLAVQIQKLKRFVTHNLTLLLLNKNFRWHEIFVPNYLNNIIIIIKSCQLLPSYNKCGFLW